MLLTRNDDTRYQADAQLPSQEWNHFIYTAEESVRIPPKIFNHYEQCVSMGAQLNIFSLGKSNTYTVKTPDQHENIHSNIRTLKFASYLLKVLTLAMGMQSSRRDLSSVRRQSGLPVLLGLYGNEKIAIEPFTLHVDKIFECTAAVIPMMQCGVRRRRGRLGRAFPSHRLPSHFVLTPELTQLRWSTPRFRIPCEVTLLKRKTCVEPYGGHFVGSVWPSFRSCR